MPAVANPEQCKVVSVAAVAGEFIGMFLFVLTGVGAAMSIPHAAGWELHVSLVFGLAITSLAYSLGHHSGAQFNCAVTWGLVLAGKLGAAQGLCNTIAQLLGSLLAALAARGIIQNDNTFGTEGPGLGTNGLAAGVTAASAFLGETVFTGLLVLVVLETACSKRSVKNSAHAALAIGLAVFLGHSVLIPLDGCSINPTRSWGPALVASWNTASKVDPFANFWVFVVGPLFGSTLAVGVYHALRKLGVNADSSWSIKQDADEDMEAIAQDDEEE